MGSQKSSHVIIVTYNRETKRCCGGSGPKIDLLRSSPKGSYCNFVDMILNLKINSFCRRQFLVVFCLKMENLAKMMASRVYVVKPLK